MAVKALTVDFWNTLVVAQTNGHIRRSKRIECLLEAVRDVRSEVSEDDILAAYRAAESHFDSSWKTEHRTPLVSELLALIWDSLKVEVTEDVHIDAVCRFEEGILAGPPHLTDGAKAALEWAASRYRLAIISDTMFSPGRVIKDLLDREGILNYFTGFVFSDETGYSKPDPRAFHAALQQLNAEPADTAHIGDLIRTDVKGAMESGLYAILYAGVHTDSDAEATAHATIYNWRQLPSIIDSLE